MFYGQNIQVKFQLMVKSLPSVIICPILQVWLLLILAKHHSIHFVAKKKVLNIFPSVDTPVCAQSVAEFNEKVAKISDAHMLCISADLPFALSRSCESYANVTALSSYRNDYAAKIGIKIEDGPMAGLAARALVVLNGNNRVLYSELVPEVSQEPDYDAALAVLVDSHVFI